MIKFASVVQIGTAAYLRNKFPPGSPMRQKLNKIVHSTDPGQKKSSNCYYDPKMRHSPVVQTVLDTCKV